MLYHAGTGIGNEHGRCSSRTCRHWQNRNHKRHGQVFGKICGCVQLLRSNGFQRARKDFQRQVSKNVELFFMNFLLSINVIFYINLVWQYNTWPTLVWIDLNNVAIFFLDQMWPDVINFTWFNIIIFLIVHVLHVY